MPAVVHFSNDVFYNALDIFAKNNEARSIYFTTRFIFCFV